MRTQTSGLDVLDDVRGAGASTSALVSAHFVLTSIRRRWKFCAATTMLGLLGALGLLTLVPPSHDARTALVLAHPEGVDSTYAMSTDIGMLTTRAVAAQTVAQLGLTITPEEFLKSIDPERVGGELLTITLSAPTEAEAVRRLSVLCTVYLDFRAEQLTRQSTFLIVGMQARVGTLQTQISDLTSRIDRLSTAGESASSRLSDLVEQRASAQSKIEVLEQSIEDATLSNNSIVSASRVIDPAAAKTGGMKRHVVLTLASGFIAGAALGCGVVVFKAVASDRLRRRSDVAEVISHPVTVSVRRISPLPRPLRWLPPVNKRDRLRTADRRRLANELINQLADAPQPRRLAAGCIGNADEVRFSVVEAAVRLASDGSRVALIDLSHEGCLKGKVLSPNPPEGLVVLRPLGSPELARDATDLKIAGQWEDEDEDSSESLVGGFDVTLILADLDPLVGADYLSTWTERVFLMVTAGRTSVERLRSVADLVRVAGLTVRGAALIAADPTDESSGLPADDDLPHHGVTEPFDQTTVKRSEAR